MAPDTPLQLSHLDPHGQAHMVDVSAKPALRRIATASAHIAISPAALQLLKEGALQKGDALAVARIAGIQAAKLTSQIIPLCHPLPLTHVGVDLTFDPSGILITTSATTVAGTGVEMEALTAAAAAALALYDMAKAADPHMTISDLHLVKKEKLPLEPATPTP
jgi:cyclic pyranopterin monophosphate synthase